MKLSDSRQQILDDRIQPSDPSSVTVTITPHTHTNECHVDVESNIEKKSTISSLLHAVAKLLPYLQPRKTEPVTGIPMRKLMTASIKDERLLDLMPTEGDIAHTLHLERINDRVRVTAHGNCAPDQLQSIVNILHPVLAPNMVGSESAREICVVADTE